MTARLAAALTGALVLTVSSLAAASPPAGYRCGKGGAPSPALEACTCPRGAKAVRSADDVAVCATRPVRPGVAPPAITPPPPLPTCPTDMVAVPGGTFDLGGPPGLAVDADERPAPRGKRTVTLSPYCLDRTEVTVAAYADCVTSGACTPAADTVEWDGLDEASRAVWNGAQVCNGDRADRRAHPINCVTWDQATAYCASLGRRLPTEAEWEYAARGSDGRVYPWGRTAPTSTLFNGCDRDCQALGKRLGFSWRSLVHDSDGFATTAPVGSFPDGASPFGALDLAGNVWEWTADEYARYDAGAFTDPAPAVTGQPPELRSYVLRGGGWDSDLRASLRAANRLEGPRALRSSSNGFRCARAGS